ncbi:hypothetical protein ACSSWA_01350 [Melioribacter sp. Ez-97]|uniref:hypothetical protein n=1 Tax=Melioribacter sp. Ez-97 TaxID=3423434 RepID=UPI003EDA0279
MAKASIKEKLYNDALVAVDKIYESNQLTIEESIEKLNDLKTQIDLRIELLKGLDKKEEEK